jgi:hypothetical protein
VTVGDIAASGMCMPCTECHFNSDAIDGLCPAECGGELSIWENNTRRLMLMAALKQRALSA